MKSGNLTSWNPLGHSRPVTGLLYLYLIVLLLSPNTFQAQSKHNFIIHLNFNELQILILYRLDDEGGDDHDDNDHDVEVVFDYDNDDDGDHDDDDHEYDVCIGSKQIAAK